MSAFCRISPECAPCFAITFFNLVALANSWKFPKSGGVVCCWLPMTFWFLVIATTNLHSEGLIRSCPFFQHCQKRNWKRLPNIPTNPPSNKNRLFGSFGQVHLVQRYLANMCESFDASALRWTHRLLVFSFCQPKIPSSSTKTMKTTTR